MNRRRMKLAGAILLLTGWPLMMGQGCPPLINTPPQADAGANQNATVGQRVTLSSISSMDADGDPLTSNWQQRGGPAVMLDNPNAATTGFVATHDNATYEFVLSVTDGRGGADTDTVLVFVGRNIASGTPVADSGVDQTVNEGTGVTLHGENSADPDGEVLRFSWRQIRGSQVSLAGRFTSRPTFTAPQVDMDTQLEFELTVSDPGDLTDTDTVIVVVGDFDQPESDRDKDNIPDTSDNCPDTPNPDQADRDGDGVGDACDACPDDPNKSDPGLCGCGVPDTDTDGDGAPDCRDNCPNDSNKLEPGECGCGVEDADTDLDGIPDCDDNCPDIYNADQTDIDGNGVGDACDFLPVCESICSDFDASDEGWRVQGKGFPVPTAPFWDGDGFVSVIFAGYGSFSWIAPTTFHGNRSCLYGQTLSFMLIGSVSKGDKLVTLGGTGLQIYYKSPIQTSYSATGFSVRLDESADWYNQETNQRVSSQEILRVLTSLSKVIITGSSWHGGEASIDNVALGYAHLNTPAGTAESRFSANDDGWRIQGGGFKLITMPFWNSDGFVSQRISSHAVSQWIAPPGLLGNRSATYGGTFSFDFVGSVNSGSGLAYLSGGGHMLYYPAQHNYSWTMANVSILLHETGQWKDIGTGQRASQQQIQETLADLTFLRINGSTWWGGELVLDNVVLQGP